MKPFTQLAKLTALFALFGAVSCASHEQDLVDADGRWLITRKAHFAESAVGLAPQAGYQLLKVDAGGIHPAMAQTDFDTRIVPGTYFISVDVGNPGDQPIAPATNVHLTALTNGAIRGSLIKPVRYWKKDGGLRAYHRDPVKGGIETWVYKYKVPHYSPYIGKQAGASLWVPGMGKDRNITFDNVQLEVKPFPFTGAFDWL